MSDAAPTTVRTLYAGYRRVTSWQGSTRMRRALQLCLLVGLVEGAAMVALMPAATTLATGDTSWGLGLEHWLTVLAGLAVVSFVARYALAMNSYHGAVDAMRAVHHGLGAQIATLPLGWFPSTFAAHASRLVTEGMMMLAGTLAHIVPVLAIDVTVSAVLLIGAWAWHPLLGAALTTSVPVYLLIGAVARRCSNRGQRILDPTEVELADRIVEFARCQGALRAAGRSADHAPLIAAQQANATAAVRHLWWSVLANLLLGGMTQGIIVSLIVLSGILSADGALDPITAVAIIGICLKFTGNLESLSGQIIGTEVQRDTLCHIDHILDASPLPEPDTSAPTPTPGSIELDRVTFGYLPERPVLKDLSLTIPARTMTALVGPSGCGKSTVTRLIGRFHDVDSGTVRVDGADIRELTTPDLMSRLSLVFQDVYLFDDTLRANIAVGRENATDAEIDRAADLAGVTEIVRRLPDGWHTQVGEGGRALSGGERQRVSIARALLKDAPIVLFDEATSALDPENEDNVVRAIEDLRCRSTLLVIAHRLDTVRRADRIVVLTAEGRIAQQGTHTELVDAPGPYRDFWQERTRAVGWRLV
ncbi:ATP-binding cassette, subfamily B [Austwickia chelonae]|uniref:Putative ABC transporter permease/ATP-binding protein n=1 Tax=Austwickia chelonae NBRC 105200 TaxID=1184607 RepID=K6V4H7_9MICO|nr:ABC transporter ATP-binding protein [Austwickia chelonae]GAB77023.1 putative ABC transporter permease/ATP-binding protein [Austwickia chelonae NBRC 105200]SEW33345.1 ATP-binding cassette, subfamily B [Austwickia chelonae]